MELVIVLTLLIISLFLFKKFNSFVYSLAIIDIFLRIINFLKINLLSSELHRFLGSNFPTSIPSIINKYTIGLFKETLMWAYVINFIILEIYLLRALFKK